MKKGHLSHHIYCQDSDLAHIKTPIIACGSDRLGNYFIPEKTLFHPEEGGQPEDRGVVSFSGTHFSITKLSTDHDGRVKHRISSPLCAHLKGQTVSLTLDLVYRHHLNQWHTAGHLMLSLIEHHYPSLTPVRANHFPSQAFITFKSCEKNPLLSYDALNAMKHLLKAKSALMIAHPRPIIINHQTPKRTVQIEGLKCYSCKGTHMKTTATLGAVEITSIEQRANGEVIFSYST